MRNLTKLPGIIALVAVIGLMAACEQPSDPFVPTLTGITLNTDSVKKAYTQNETLNLSGLVVTATYDDGSTAAVTGYTADPVNGAALSTTGTITVTISYTEETVTKTATFTVTVAAPTPADITYTAVQTGGTDNAVDSTGIVFTFSASVDSLGLTAADINVGGAAAKDTMAALSGSGTMRTLAITVSVAGSATVTIAKAGIEPETKNFTVYKAGQSAPTLTGITAVYNGMTTIYPATPLDDLKTGLTVKAQYSNSSETTLTENEYTLGGTLTVGSSTVTVTYQDQTTSFIVTVTAAPAKTLTGITLNTDSVKKDYIQNEALNLSGLVVTATYSDSSSATVTGYTASPTNGASLSAIETTTVTISYTESGVTKTAIFTVTVADPGTDPGHTHNWGNWTQTSAPTETTNGEEKRVCTLDSSHIETRPLYATGTGGLAFELISGGVNNGTYCVNKGTVTNGEVHIPAYWRGNSTNYADYKPVTEIAASDGGWSGAFVNTGITTIHIPASVTAIGEYAFSNCTSLGTVIFAEGSQLTTIGDYAFYGCSSYNFTSITIPASVTAIGGSAFSSTHINDIVIPASVTSIGESALAGTSLNSITVDANNPNYASDSGILYNKAKTAIVAVPKRKSGTVTIPASVTEISDRMFQSCWVTSVIFAEGSQLQSIGEFAFSGTWLTAIIIPAGVTTIGDLAFYNCASLTSVTTPNALLTPCYALLL